MAAKVEFKLDGRMLKEMRGRIGHFTFDVGVLKDGPHKRPGKGIKPLAGGPSRRVSRKNSGMSISEVSESLRSQTGINFYTKPFKSKANKDLLKFIQAFMKYFGSGKSDVKRLENSLQAVVRNPITRGDYGGNTRATAKRKGFSRLMVDTGQLFKAIVAKVKVNRNV